MSPDLSPADLSAIQGKPRPKGSLPYLPNERDPEALGAWLTFALRPADGWRVVGFERTGRDPLDAALLHLRNGRESKTYRFRHQKDLVSSPRQVVTGVTDGWLEVPHLTLGEVEDLWVGLCRFGQVLTEHDEAAEAYRWLEQMLLASSPLTGHSLVPDQRHDGLMALKRLGEFTKTDALVLLRPGEERWVRRPVRFIDNADGAQWVRAGEAATFIRWVVGVEPISHSTLRARLSEVGVTGRLFEDHRPPHPKLTMLELSDELAEGVPVPK